MSSCATSANLHCCCPPGGWQLGIFGVIAIVIDIIIVIVIIVVNIIIMIVNITTGKLGPKTLNMPPT